MNDQLTKEDVVEAVTIAFERFGFNVQDPARMRSNMEFLDRLHGSADTIGTSAKKAAATTLVTAVMGLVWLGFSDKIKGLFG